MSVRPDDQQIVGDGGATSLSYHASGRRLVRTPEEFAAQSAEKHIDQWVIHNCSFCRYPCGFLFRDGTVGYDAGCHCVTCPDGVRHSSWGEVAKSYNRQTHPDVIAKMDAFWGFAAPGEPPCVAVR